MPDLATIVLRSSTLFASAGRHAFGGGRILPLQECKRQKRRALLSSRRSRHGGSIVELPVAIWLLFIILLFPFLDVATMVYRSTVVFAAARNGAHYGGRCTTYGGAQTTAWQAIQNTLNNSSPGVTINQSDVVYHIVGNPVPGGNPAAGPTAGWPMIYQTAALTIPTPAPFLPDPDTTGTKYVYEFQVTVTGHVQPLISLSSEVFGHIAGLTDPLPVTATSREIFEYPSGLTVGMRPSGKGRSWICDEAPECQPAKV